MQIQVKQVNNFSAALKFIVKQVDMQRHNLNKFCLGYSTECQIVNNRFNFQHFETSLHRPEQQKYAYYILHHKKMQNPAAQYKQCSPQQL